MTVEKLEWKVHTSALLDEVLLNSGTGILATPLRIFRGLLHDVAVRASELNDPALNILMLRLTLYDAADPDKHSYVEINRVMAEQKARLK